VSEQQNPAVQTVDPETLSFEQAQAELERIVAQLEDQHTGLEQALALWERGEALHAYCQRKLDYAAARIERLNVTAEEAAAATAEPDPFTGAVSGGHAEQPAHDTDAVQARDTVPAAAAPARAARAEEAPVEGTPQSMF